MVVMSLAFTILLVLGLVGFVFLIKSYDSGSFMELCAFECGMPSSINSGPIFSVRFFLLCLIFIILDIETITVLFHPLMVMSDGGLGFVFVLIALWVFCGLTLWEWLKGGLDWVL
uniref:NADH-ubiquinone oxidoreductase chain 3 n=1 Tax=Brentisentis yangtzensis TaxID=2604967 RepID=A0A5B9RFX4_9BILA|nr:NADH dehydrogenase subunit 3 [Brentisentis yangtzensis]